MSIKKVNSKLPRQDQIDDLNDMILELDGLTEKGRFDLNELDQFITDLGIDRKFLRNQSLGHSLATYASWSHLYAETGYSIWKFSPTNYTYNILNELYIDNKQITNKGLADSEVATTFTKVFLYNGDSGSGYTDNTTEAGLENGTEFDIFNSANDYLYLGSSSTFGGIKFEFQTRGSNNTLKIEYFSDESGVNNWVELTSNINNLVDNTSNFESDGTITFTIPDSWAQTIVNSQNLYWIRISSTTVPTTVAKAYYIIPGNSVIGLLALSSEELLDETWKWCSYGTSIYVTIRNSGAAAYEGNFYITSTSSITNKQNYFIYNHEFTSDYEDSTYSATSLSQAIDDSLVSFSHSSFLSTNVHDAIVEARNKGYQYLWKTIVSDSGQAIANAIEDILNIVGGSGITTAIVGDTLTITSTAGSVSIGGAPLTLSGQEITFNYDTNDFQLDGNNLQIKDSGIDHDSLTNTHNLTTNIDHGLISGLGDDDHTQYHNNARATSWLMLQNIDIFNDVAISSGITTDDLFKWNGSRWSNWTSPYNTRIVILKVIADDTALTTGDGKMYFTIPYQLNGMNLIDADAHVYTVSSSGTPTVAIYNLTDSHDMLTTNITIDANEKDSATAATAPVIDYAYDDVATGDEIRIDVDVAGTGTKGLEVRLVFKQ